MPTFGKRRHANDPAVTSAASTPEFRTTPAVPKAIAPLGHPVDYQLPDGERVYAIGDIHGSLQPLLALHELLAEDRSMFPVTRATLVYLGDYVDRGAESAEVLDLVLEQPKWADRVVRLLGNHEEMFLDFLTGGPRSDVFVFNGGVQTLASYGFMAPMPWSRTTRQAIAETANEHLPAAHRALLESKAYFERIGQFYFCHAGIQPGKRLDEQKPDDLKWIRREFLDTTDDFGVYVVHGHTTVPDADLRGNRLGIDTGAYRTGRLTAAAIEGNRIRLITT